MNHVDLTRKIVNILKENSFDKEAEVLEEAISSASTGSELCMALKHNAGMVLKNKSIPDDIRKEIEELNNTLAKVLKT